MGRKAIDLAGKRFGKLTAMEPVRDNNGIIRWRCQCDCGKETFTRSTRLASGETTSCGCTSRSQIASFASKGGAATKTHGQSRTRLYRIWDGMKNRCYYPSHKAYNNYGGRGIVVCEEWRHDFIAFRDWAMTNGYQDDLTIDRIDNDKGYSPDNCRWTTYFEQARNQRRYTKGGDV